MNTTVLKPGEPMLPRLPSKPCQAPFLVPYPMHAVCHHALSYCFSSKYRACLSTHQLARRIGGRLQRPLITSPFGAEPSSAPSWLILPGRAERLRCPHRSRNHGRGIEWNRNARVLSLQMFVRRTGHKLFRPRLVHATSHPLRSDTPPRSCTLATRNSPPVVGLLLHTAFPTPC